MTTPANPNSSVQSFLLTMGNDPLLSINVIVSQHNGGIRLDVQPVNGAGAAIQSPVPSATHAGGPIASSSAVPSSVQVSSTPNSAQGQNGALPPNYTPNHPHGAPPAYSPASRSVALATGIAAPAGAQTHSGVQPLPAIAHGNSNSNSNPNPHTAVAIQLPSAVAGQTGPGMGAGLTLNLNLNLNVHAPSSQPPMNPAPALVATLLPLPIPTIPIPPPTRTLRTARPERRRRLHPMIPSTISRPSPPPAERDSEVGFLAALLDFVNPLQGGPAVGSKRTFAGDEDEDDEEAEGEGMTRRRNAKRRRV